MRQATCLPSPLIFVFRGFPVQRLADKICAVIGPRTRSRKRTVKAAIISNMKECSKDHRIWGEIPTIGCLRDRLFGEGRRSTVGNGENLGFRCSWHGICTAGSRQRTNGSAAEIWSKTMQISRNSLSFRSDTMFGIWEALGQDSRHQRELVPHRVRRGRDLQSRICGARLCGRRCARSGLAPHLSEPCGCREPKRRP